MAIRKQILDRWTKHPLMIMSSPTELEHWAVTINTVFEYETLLSEALSRFFVSRNSKVSHDMAEELYDDRGPLSSLTKMADVAFYLALIDEKMRHDLKKFWKLRSTYAHDPKRGPLGKDAKMFKLVTDTYVFQESRDVLKNQTPQQVFLCIIDEIKSQLKELP